ncbi:MAG: CsgG/HfaB family protein [Gemmatimonadota bacterium]|nr:CsgG/HfaB family protein [Gemmatimonadota bacterium]
MRLLSTRSAVVFCALTLAIVSLPAKAQYPADVASATPASAVSQPLNRTAADPRPSLVVMNFESGTVAAKVKDKHGFSAFLAAMRGERDNEHYDPAELGAGIADMLVEKILNTGEFRLLERKQIEAAVREQMIAAGVIN